MKLSGPCLKTTCFLSTASVVWIVLIHGIAIRFFGLSPLAGWVVVGGLGLTVISILSYLAWEFRQAKTVGTEPVQQISSLPSYRTRVPASHQLPAIDGIALRHQTPHLGRRLRARKTRPAVATGPLLGSS